MSHRRNPFSPSRIARNLLIVGGAMAASVAALAAPERGKPEFPISISEARERADARFAELDTNGDGVISREEFAAATWMSRQGMRKHGHRHMRSGMAHGKPKRMRDRPADAAGDADREARREAWRERRAAADQALFDALDADGDGKLSSEEFSSRRIHEARRQIAMDRLFDRLDRNDDGVLSRDEWPNWVARLEAMDADGDGIVTEAEARAFRESRQRPSRFGATD